MLDDFPILFSCHLDLASRLFIFVGPTFILSKKSAFCKSVNLCAERHARAIFCSSNVEIPRARRPWDFDIRAAKDSRGYPVMPYVAHLGQNAISRLMHDDQCFSLILRAI